MIAAYYSSSFDSAMRWAVLVIVAVLLVSFVAALVRAVVLDRTRPGWRTARRKERAL
jgi:ABC-type sugar transport system permease subunit